MVSSTSLASSTKISTISGSSSCVTLAAGAVAGTGAGVPSSTAVSADVAAAAAAASTSARTTSALSSLAGSTGVSSTSCAVGANSAAVASSLPTTGASTSSDVTMIPSAAATASTASLLSSTVGTTGVRGAGIARCSRTIPDKASIERCKVSLISAESCVGSSARIANNVFVSALIRSMRSYPSAPAKAVTWSRFCRNRSTAS